MSAEMTRWLPPEFELHAALFTSVDCKGTEATSRQPLSRSTMAGRAATAISIKTDARCRGTSNAPVPAY